MSKYVIGYDPGSVFSSNSAYGAMALQGMLFAQMLSDCAPNIQFINETHPKVAYYAIAKPTRHDYLTVFLLRYHSELVEPG